MRRPALLLFFVLSAVLAACGGGGGSGTSVLPNVGASNAPTGIPMAQAAVVLHIPPPSAQGQVRRPFYISSATKSVSILVAPNASATPSPLPTAQVFPVAVPSPCVTTSAGGATCTFNVQAPIGNDIFVVATYATAAPNASAVPLSVAQGTATITLNPSASPSPMSFALNAIVTSVSISVPSPDPSNTPNTQLFTAGVAASPVPLTVTALDASGNTVLSDPTTPFLSPVTVKISPPPGISGTAGFALGFSPSCPGGTASTSAAVIACAGDLNKVTLSYDGSVNVDSSNHIVDNVSLIATPAQSSAPVAHAVLQSNVILYALPLPATNPVPAQLQTLSNGQIAYMYRQGTAWGIGTFNPAAGTNGVVNAPVTNTTSTAFVQAFAISADLTSVWAFDFTTKSMMCWNGISAVSGPPSKTLAITTSLSYPIRVNAMSFDGSGDLWYEGVDTSVGQNWAGYIPTTANCGAPASAPAAQVAITGDSGDYSSYLGTTQSGAAWNSGYQGLYVFNTSSSSAAAIAPAGGVSPYGYGGGVASDAAGNIYMGYTANSSMPPTTPDMEELTSGSAGPLTSLLTLTPGSTGVSSTYGSVHGVSVFSNAGGMGDRVSYIDSNLGSLGFVDSLQSSPTSALVTLPNGAPPLATAFTKTGEPVALLSGGTSLYLARVLATTTWNVPVTSFTLGCSALPMAIVQRGASSAPFTVSISNGITATAFPAPNKLNFMLGSATAGTPTITVTDASGRMRSFNATITSGVCP